MRANAIAVGPHAGDWAPRARTTLVIRVARSTIFNAPPRYDVEVGYCT
jgi:hypothetical protein